jgi:glycosyltransferase involved in cell wall biosynthesis
MVGYTFYDCDNRVRRYAETLARRGDEVDVIALRSESEAKREIVNGVQVFRIQRRRIDEVGRFSYLLRLFRFLIHSMVFLARRDWRRHYDLVHVHSIPDFEIFAAWLPKLRGAKLILDIHDLVPEFYASKFNAASTSHGKRLLVLVERLSAQFAHHVIIANDLWRDRLLQRSAKDAHCTTILNYPDESIFYRRGRTRSDDKFVMLYPGSLSRHQGLDLAIRALARIRDRAPHAELRIYGKGDQLEALVRLAHELGLEDRVHFHDAVALTEIARIMENADLGIVPKRTDGFGNEALSTKIPEFMALGVPVIASNSQVERRYFPSSAIKFFNPNSETELADCMLTMIRHPEERQARVCQGDEFIRTFGWEANKQRYLNLVDRLTSTAKVHAMQRSAA